jgi:ABC-type nitrate/sulfonate/bicarbonate transport system ATPase subunit
VLSVRSLQMEYPAEGGRTVPAAQDVSFEVPGGKLFTLLGPSGCGKTTTLRGIAGLERPRRGEVEADGRIVYSAAKGVFVAPNRRNFGMVFQSYAIWPHMNVFQNAAFPLEVGRRRLGRKEIEARVMRVLGAVALDHLADRAATKLSGGQQQRLALARALVMEPTLLLLDEPLSNLDAKLRERMRFELKRLQRELRITTVYVTHDQSEALLLAARQLGCRTVREIVQRDGAQNAHHLVGELRPTELAAADLERKRRILEDAHMRPDGVGLEHHAEIAPVRGDEDSPLRREHELPTYRDLARLRPFEPGDRAQRRRLPAAARAEQREQLARRHLERDVLRGDPRLTAVAGIFGP